MGESSGEDRRLFSMSKMTALLASAILAWSLGACRKDAPAGAPSPALARIEGLARFRPPADGLLTPAQVDRYIRVRRAARGRPGAEAARAVGVDPEEYSWVRTRVIEALVALDTRKVRMSSEETYAKTIAAMRVARQSARDREVLRALDEQIAGLERERTSLKQMETLPSSIAENAKRLAARRAEIEALSP